ncbi:uncharacterized protein BCR38DRAFT_436234 [Pseudomassariella vexata]|uniref:Uncharacterized protein n=1 Tax=Pseudomassariella vexata TaxID=1141098 RepID=A0A1Y2DVE4_9PEZI|nr:uncharacterized protein BCR38DRAFT_436234 [Pseudomassariella vexata]ORY63218.1 hypothetical protein BCR38DRAFT_436234 [Pseudomassariella vexata]
MQLPQRGSIFEAGFGPASGGTDEWLEDLPSKSGPGASPSHGLNADGLPGQSRLDESSRTLARRIHKFKIRKWLRKVGGRTKSKLTKKRVLWVRHNKGNSWGAAKQKKKKAAPPKKRMSLMMLLTSGNDKRDEKK